MKELTLIFINTEDTGIEDPPDPADYPLVDRILWSISNIDLVGPIQAEVYNS